MCDASQPYAQASGTAARPRLVIAIAILLGLGGAALALRLHPTAAANTFVSSSSVEYRETQRFYSSFGEEPVEVLVKGDLQQLVLSSDIERLVGLEGCLSGNVPASALAAEGGASGTCGALRSLAEHQGRLRTGDVRQRGSQPDRCAARGADQASRSRGRPGRTRRPPRRWPGASARAKPGRSVARRARPPPRFQEGLATLALQYGLTAPPSLEDRNFVSTLVFDSTKPAGTPKQRFAYLFPSHDAALVSVRMKAGLSESARTRTIGLIRQAVAMPQWRLQHGESYLVTGEPVIVSDLNHSITRSIELLLIAVLLVMAGTLGLVFSGRPRLLPLAVALLAAALTFGALSLAGASLTMASIAVLPVLVGLAVDYAIQFQSRVHEGLAQNG